jgi:hypothetical protein
MLSPSCPREGEEGAADVEDVVEVTIAEEDDDDDKPVKVIPVLDSSPPRPAYKQMTWIWIGP